ncbi:hypothetical protein ACFL2A_02925 [Thermodesulfobacteriota bacterium]
MGFLDRIFGAGPASGDNNDEKVQGPLFKNECGCGSAHCAEPAGSCVAEDNSGFWIGEEADAKSYWAEREAAKNSEPFLLYEFNSGPSAAEALIALDFIHVASDNNDIICIEPLVYGYYPIDNHYEVILSGDELTHDDWYEAKEIFAKFGGTSKNEQAPAGMKQSAAKVSTPEKPPESKIVYVEEERKEMLGQTMIYKVYKGPDAASAMEFLEANPVDAPNFHLVVETPEGDYCRDIKGIFKED